MTDDPLRPFKKKSAIEEAATGGIAQRFFEEERKRRKFLDDAIGGTAARYIREAQERRKLLDDALGGSAARFIREEQERQRLFSQSAIGKAAQGIIDQQSEQRRQLASITGTSMQEYFAAETARRRAYDVGNLASSKLFQENMASAVAAIVGPTTTLTEQLKASGVFTRIAEQQSALIKASMGISDQFKDIQRALQDAMPNTAQISAALGVQSALAEQMRRISEQVNELNGSFIAGRIKESAVWETMRETYGLDDTMSMAQAFEEIGTQLEQPTTESKSFGFYDAWQIIQFLWFVYSAYAMIAGLGDYTDEDRARDNSAAQSIERIEARQQMERVEEALANASALAEAARINELPRAFVLKAANVRAAPDQKAERIARLGPNTMMAIEETRGKWVRVIFADTVSQTAAEGWVWRASIEPLSES